MADVTRDQFDESKDVEYKIFQKEVPVVAADFNEQVQVARHREMRILSALADNLNRRFGDGFKVVEHASANTLTVKGGACAIHLESGKAIPLRCSDTDIAGWTTPSGSDRTDYLYADVSLEEIDTDQDPNLINPAVGQESAIDKRLTWSFEKSEGAAPGTPPADHVFINIAQIDRLDGNSSITDAMISNLLACGLDIKGDLTVRGTSEFQDDITLSSDKTIDGIDPSKLAQVIWSMGLEVDYHSVNAGDTVAWNDGPPFVVPCWEVTTGSANEVKLVKPHIKLPNMNYLRISAEVRETGSGSVLRFYAGASYVDIDIPGTTGVETAYIDISGLTDWDTFDIKVELRNGSSDCFARKVVIYETYE
jgi:hypothetical protein